MATARPQDRPVIYWVHDHRASNRPGGAQFTNQLMLAQAPKWCEVIEVYPDNADLMRWHDTLCKLVIFNNIREFTAPQLAKFASLPFMVYAHDFWQYKERWQLRLFGDLLRDAHAMVYLSPLHKETFEEKWRHVNFGSDGLICPPPFELGKYKSDLPKDPDHGFCYVGEFGAHKGLADIDLWARNHKVKIDCYGWGDLSKYQNLVDCGFVDPRDMPALLATYYGFVFLPKDIEPFGRASAEAMLSGCVPVFNRRVGSLSYGWHDDPDTWKEMLAKSPGLFWDFVQTVYNDYVRP